MAAFLRFSGRSRLFIPTKFPKWAGVVIAIPACAVVQGSLMLNDYRMNHRDAPHPVSPSRGVVVVSPQDLSADGTDPGESRPLALFEGASRRPIRLLVIGDSLAAGVGISKSGTPVLPESIARSLSKASGGRPVYWTCVGTPGASSSQIVRDIGNVDELLNENFLKCKIADWHEAKQRAQKWIKNRLSHAQPHVGGGSNIMDKLVGWYGAISAKKKSSLQQSNSSSNDVAFEGRTEQMKKLRMAREIDERYDVAVVMTGINDVKNSYLPWMKEIEMQSGESGLGAELLKVVRALKSKMKVDRRQAHVDSPEVWRRPLVVFPALPASSLPVFQYAPLRWFAVPLIQAMDHSKKELSERFPGSVLFVESPSASVLSDIEAGRGQLWSKRRTEDVLVKLTDVTHKARDKVEHLMKKHYQPWANKTRDSEGVRHREDDPSDAFEQSCQNHWLQLTSAPGSSLIAADKVHPNDEGYDFWGRHIAEAILQEWKR